jgi:MFS superfamily sulfate permease-like transporter
VVAGVTYASSLSSNLASTRHRCRHRADDNVGAGWYCLRDRIGPAGICGLYATIVPLLAYALFGPSRILVLGPDSSLAAVILGVVLAHAGSDPGRAMALAGMMAVVSGIVCILAGVARLGFVTELLSKPIRYGYMNGIALTVLISQLPKLFGISIEDNGPLRELWAIKSELGSVRERRRYAGSNSTT